MQAKPIMVPLHTVPSPIEQEHIRQAIDASQTAIAAIGTITTVAAVAIAILAIFVGFGAIVGWSTLKDEFREKAEKIANERMDAYMKSDDFKILIERRIEKEIEIRWQNHILNLVTSIDGGSIDDQSEFPPDGNVK